MLRRVSSLATSMFFFCCVFACHLGKLPSLGLPLLVLTRLLPTLGILLFQPGIAMHLAFARSFLSLREAVIGVCPRTRRNRWQARFFPYSCGRFLQLDEIVVSWSRLPHAYIGSEKDRGAWSKKVLAWAGIVSDWGDRVGRCCDFKRLGLRPHGFACCVILGNYSPGGATRVGCTRCRFR